LFNGILLTLLLGHSVYRDILLEKQYPGDLRNRIVGARLQKDGKLPYHYFQYPGDGMRYYDMENHIRNSSSPSNITASPFFHELLFPICDLPQRTISIIWLWLQYIFLFAITAMICSLTPGRDKKWLIVNFAVLFTATEAWIEVISSGQLYFAEAFLMTCILFFLTRNKKTGKAIAGVLASMFVLTRPIAIVMFIPFLFYFREYLLFLLTAICGLALYSLFVLTNPYEKALYQDYVSGMKMHVQNHQNLAGKPNPIPQYEDVHNLNLEGFDFNEVLKERAEHPHHDFPEDGNIFVIYMLVTHQKMPVAILNTLSAITIGILCVLFFYRNKKNPVKTEQILVFGFTLYMVVELFNPVHRHQYNSVQWFPLVLAGLIPVVAWKDPVFLLMTMGLLLNICNFSWLPMRHTLGEFCWLAALLMLVLTSPYNLRTWKKRS
jgi:hypothetical protein